MNHKCSYKSNENYTIDDKSVLNIMPRNYQYTNNLKKQYATSWLEITMKTKRIEETSATITIKFSTLYDKVKSRKWE